MPERYLNAKTIGALLDVHPKTIHRWVKEGSFPAPIKIGGLDRWREAEVNAFLLGLERERILAETEVEKSDNREQRGTSARKPRNEA